MPTAKPYARIAITLPESELAAADRLAKSQDRSRSWVIAEAIRYYVASLELAAEQMHGEALDRHTPQATPVFTPIMPPTFLARATPGIGTVSVSSRRDMHDSAAPVHDSIQITAQRGSRADVDDHPSNLDASRLLRLQHDMALTPEQRVRLADERVRLRTATESPRRRHVLAFDSYEDYARWKQSRLADS
ncbi:MAG: CopG family transcriptional regulator [Gemmatimonadaceae bacterium]|nr:CopG family transcriptional regulator [Gemmatimonadaceae bacterium]